MKLEKTASLSIQAQEMFILWIYFVSPMAYVVVALKGGTLLSLGTGIVCLWICLQCHELLRISVSRRDMRDATRSLRAIRDGGLRLYEGHPIVAPSEDTEHIRIISVCQPVVNAPSISAHVAYSDLSDGGRSLLLIAAGRTPKVSLTQVQEFFVHHERGHILGASLYRRLAADYAAVYAILAVVPLLLLLPADATTGIGLVIAALVFLFLGGVPHGNEVAADVYAYTEMRRLRRGDMARLRRILLEWLGSSARDMGSGRLWRSLEFLTRKRHVQYIDDLEKKGRADAVIAVAFGFEPVCWMVRLGLLMMVVVRGRAATSWHGFAALLGAAIVLTALHGKWGRALEIQSARVHAMVDSEVEVARRSDCEPLQADG